MGRRPALVPEKRINGQGHSLTFPFSSDILDKYDKPVGIKAAVFFIFIASFGVIAGIYSGTGVFLAAAVIGFAGVVLLVRYPLLWFSAIILGYIPVLWQWSTEFTPTEFVHAIVLYGGLLWWFFERIILKRKNLFWSFGGKMLATLFLFIIAMIPVSLACNAEAVPLARETCIMGGLLLGVPLAHELKSRRDWTVVGGLLFIMFVAFSLRNIVQYRQKIISAIAYWQVGASRATESSYILLVGTIITVVLLFSVTQWRYRVLWLGSSIIGVIALILTFFRTVWISGCFAIILLFVILGRKFWKKIFVFGACSFVLGVLLFFTVFRTTFSLNAIESALTDRFASIKMYKVDPSVRNRNVEALASLKQIPPNVLIGYGLSTEVHFINMIIWVTVRTRWSHNAFPWMLYHFGIIGSLILLASFFGYLLQAFMMFIRARHINSFHFVPLEILRPLLAGVFVALVAILLNFWTSNPYIDRGCSLIFSVLYGFLDFTQMQFRAVVPETDASVR
jgi:hypothetical protein